MKDNEKALLYFKMVKCYNTLNLPTMSTEEVLYLITLVYNDLSTKDYQIGVELKRENI